MCAHARACVGAWAQPRPARQHLDDLAVLTLIHDIGMWWFLTAY